MTVALAATRGFDCIARPVTHPDALSGTNPGVFTYPLGMVPRRLAAIVVACALVAACTGSETSEPTPPSFAPSSPPSVGSPASVIPLLISPQNAVGDRRFLFSLVDPSTNQPVAAPDREVDVRFLPPAGGRPIDAGQATFVWGIENERGVYVSPVEFTTGGDWAAEFTTQGLRGANETVRVDFPVADNASAVAVGEPAPASDTPTADDVGGQLERISTDTDPLPAFYEQSIADALAAGEPFAIVFATPKFCQTAQCGPTLERIKPFVERHPEVTFIHVEPYRLVWQEDQLQPELDDQNQLQTVPAVDEYGILAEPWVYVVDRDGIVRGSFELIFADEELTQALDAVS
jgi:hypothetical protein